MKLSTRVFILACFITTSISAIAQPAGPDSPAEPQDTTSGLAPEVNDEIALEPTVPDQEIAGRLTEVYEVSGWYEDLTVEVEDGVVIIDGRAEHEAARDWAGTVAEQTEGVAAVVNRLEISIPPAINTYSIREELAGLWHAFIRLLPLIVAGLIVFVIALLIARFISRWLAVPIGRLTDSRLMENISRKLIALVIVLIGLILFLRISGLTGIAVTIASGTGILGLIIGFAFRDIAENFLASILISIQSPFRLGDVIEVDGHTGVVHKVTARGTVLVDFDGNHIQIANATVYKSTLINYTANPKRRLRFVVGIGYDASVITAQDIAMRVLQDHSAVLDDPEPLVLVDQLGNATINLKVYYWIDGNAHSVLKVQSAIMRQVMRALEQAGISMPDEAREIIFPDGVPVTMSAAEPERTGADADTGSAETTPTQKQRETVDSDLADDASRSEGNLTSEVSEIKTQAAQSREVEDGSDILGDEDR